MAKRRDNDLMKTLRDSGVRKKVARAVTGATEKATGKEREFVNRTVQNLRAAADALESRVGGSQRSEAAKKAARTRKRNAAQGSNSRSNSARKTTRKSARKTTRSRSRSA